MKSNSKYLATIVLSLFATVFCAIISGFASHSAQPNRGNIEGYVFPRVANPRVIVAIPHPQRPDDTLHRIAIPNASGYFKLNNIPVGTQAIIYEPKYRTYRSKSKTITVTAAQTANAGTETLDLEQ